MPQVYGGLPPLAAQLAEYAWPTDVGPAAGVQLSERAGLIVIV